MKALIISLITLACTILAFIPEAIMYFLFHFINPTTELGRIATSGLILWFGVGFSFLFAVVALVVWVSFAGAAMKVYR